MSKTKFEKYADLKVLVEAAEGGDPAAIKILEEDLNDRELLLSILVAHLGSSGGAATVLTPHVETEGTQATAIPAGQSHVVIQPAVGVTLTYQGITYSSMFVPRASAGRGTPLLNNTKITGGDYKWGAWK